MDDREFHGLKLDRFQIEAIDHVDAGASVIVSAATGTGKTLIADYVIDRAFKQGKKVFYTAPIKALSNQKFADFSRAYGKENVGILTGDVVFNAKAPLLIMTTEIYRNMLLAEDPILKELSSVVFDEIHYLGDEERGTVWEEAIIFSPAHMRFLCLSATIPNARQFANWIEEIKGHPVHVVVEKKRAVPLTHQYFDNRVGISTIEEIRKRKSAGAYPKYSDTMYGGRGKSRGRNMRTRSHSQSAPKQQTLTHVDLILSLQKQELLPCIYFCFRRAGTEAKALELSQRVSFLTPEQTKQVDAYIEEKFADIDEAIRKLETTKLLASCLRSGVAFHHAGLLPVLKELVEGIFAHNLLTVLYATETFAVGINLPARTVCFDSLEKYDGTSFRYLRSKEYFQLAGRAGRRGLDKIGHAISYVDPEFADLGKVKDLTSGDSEPLMSQYKLSYNTILNLIANHTEKERDVILRSSFWAYQTAGKHRERIVEVYKKKVVLLEKLGYLEQGTLTVRGEFARRIYSHELILTELFTTSLTKQFTDFHMILLCGALEFEEKRTITFAKKPSPASLELLEMFRPYKSIAEYFRETGMKKIEPMLSAWYRGDHFGSLLDLTTMPEGDIVRFMRRIIDVLQQVMHATTDETLRNRIEACIVTIDRDIVQVRL